MKKVILCILLATTLVTTLVGCRKEEPKQIEVTIVGHDIKTVLKDGNVTKEYYLQIKAPNESTFLVKVDYQEKLMYTFQGTYRTGTKITVLEKDLIPFEVSK